MGGGEGFGWKFPVLLTNPSGQKCQLLQNGWSFISERQTVKEKRRGGGGGGKKNACL